MYSIGEEDGVCRRDYLKMADSTIDVFLALVRAGLWERDVRLSEFKQINFSEVYRLAEEQSVVGLVAAGIEHIVDKRVPQEMALQFAGQTLQLEKQNKSMNGFVAELIERLRKEGIYCLLVKGQGVAQCYERPLWRSCGDVDLYLSEENYIKTKSFLIPLASSVNEEDKKRKHLGLKIDSWIVELHGALPFGISRKVDKVIDETHKEIFFYGSVRSWMNGKTQVFLPAPNCDIIIVFTHLLHHFFIEGVGLRQICDWCRLLWTYKDSLNYAILKSQIRKMGLLSEWKVFASLAVNTLGMPVEAMPFYDERFRAKGLKVLRRVLKSGNFGHNNDLSYRTKYSGLSYKIVALWRRFVDFASLVPIFPVDAPKFFFTYMFHKAK